MNASRRFNFFSGMLYVLVIITVISFLALLQHCRYLVNRNMVIKSLTMVSKSSGKLKQLDDKSFKFVANLKDRALDMREQYYISPQKYLENITFLLPTGKLFSVIRDVNMDNYYFSSLRRVRSEKRHRHGFLIRGQSICRGEKPFLLIIIPSMASHIRIRQVIRDTWIKAALSNTWPGLQIEEKVRYLFFLAKTTFNDNHLRQLKFESSMHQDIVLSDVIDSYRNLSRKMVSAMQWVAKYCSEAEYVLKVDEDTFVNVPLIIKVISLAAGTLESNRFVLGRSHGSVLPEVTRNGRWAVSKRDYPFDYFPRYLYGHSYVFSRASIPAVVAMADHVGLIPPEDVYLTGILTKLANVTRINAACFTVCCIDLFDCDVVWNQFVTMTAVSSVEDHTRLWKSVTERKCHPKIAFNYNKRYPHLKPVTIST